MMKIAGMRTFIFESTDGGAGEAAGYCYCALQNVTNYLICAVSNKETASILAANLLTTRVVMVRCQMVMARARRV